MADNGGILTRFSIDLVLGHGYRVISMKSYKRLVDFCPRDRRYVTIGRYLFPWLSVISMGMQDPRG